MGSPSQTLISTLQTRHSMLAELCTASYTKRQLETTLDVSRSTVNRGLRDLQEESLAEYDGGEWQATAFGRHAVRVRESYLTELASFEEADVFLEQLAQEGVLNYDFLRGVTVHKAEAAAPCKILEQFITQTTRGTTVRIIAPRDVFGCTRVVYNRLCEREKYGLELLVADDVLESFREVFPEFAQSLLRDCGVRFHRATVPFSFGLWIVDETAAGVIIYGDYGIAGLLVNNSPRSVEWAKSQFQTVEAHAEEVELAHVTAVTEAEPTSTR